MRAIQTDLAPKPIGPYSQAIQSGRLIFISGQIPLVPATGKLVEGEIREQARQALNNLAAVVKAAGADLAAVVKTTVFMLDLKEFGAVNEVYQEFFQAPFPARAVVAAAGLPAGARIEIEAIASLGD